MKFLAECTDEGSGAMASVTEILKNKWMTQEILYKMDERRLAKNFPEKYKQLNKEVRKMCKKAKEEYLE